jgi:hypothetical protein
MRNLVLPFLVLAIICPPSTSLAQVATRVRVRVVAHDAKVIGDEMGGARITIRDAATGEVLAQGNQRGGTGSTDALVSNPIGRGDPVCDLDGAAFFETALELTEPTVLEFVGEGPLAYEHAMQRTSRRMLVVPGQDILENGVVLELNGFVVELLAPVEITDSLRATRVTARVRMMCGCTLEPGGLWDASRVRVVARLYHAGRLLKEEHLVYAGEPSLFAGEISFAGVPGGSELVVLALYPSRANFGISKPATYSRY